MGRRPTEIALGRMVRAGIEVLGALIAPTSCAACDLILRDPRRMFCAACETAVEKKVTQSRGVISVFEYGGAMATAIARFKYRERSDLGARFGRAMAESVAELDLRRSIDVVLPVPLHPMRLAERGYNQSLLLARPVARELRLRLLPHALRRVRHTPQQVGLDSLERQRNLYGAFDFRRPQPLHQGVRDARILLIDDVCTTGATIDGCARALIEAGARTVQALVLARRS